MINGPFHVRIRRRNQPDIHFPRFGSAPSFDFARFDKAFKKSSKKAGKEQYLVPYFISSHPGSAVEDMIELAVFLKQRGYRPRQVQDFIPAPMDVATSIYHTGLDPFTMKPVSTPRRLKDRATQ
ncbi:MAG: DUF3362 domain-containing protein, partial [Planctomycetes bacterium]|nr:DUF3362 domain-containing protein [Planctomycetota bacterium]